MINKAFNKAVNFLKKQTLGMPVVSGMQISKKFIADKLPPRPAIVDCGAHNGADTIELAKITGSKVYAFEPVEHLYSQLIQNTSSFPNVKCFKVALNEFDGKAEMHLSSGDSDGSSSLLKPKIHLEDHPNVFFHEIIEVECLTLDTWAEKNNVDKIDMLWLDMQGSELSMLKASEKIFHTVSVIHSEVSLKETYEGVEHYEVYKHFLLGHGYKVVKEAIPRGFDMGNVLFVKSF
jgi:FkbM family methyltransferase